MLSGLFTRLTAAEWWGSQDAWLRKKTQEWKKGMDKMERERATWTPSVSAKVNITDIPPGTLAYRDQRSWWQTSDPGALKGQERSLWNLSAGGQSTERDMFSGPEATNKEKVNYNASVQDPTCGSSRKKKHYKHTYTNKTAKMCWTDLYILQSFIQSCTSNLAILAGVQSHLQPCGKKTDMLSTATWALHSGTIFIRLCCTGSAAVV